MVFDFIRISGSLFTPFISATASAATSAVTSMAGAASDAASAVASTASNAASTVASTASSAASTAASAASAASDVVSSSSSASTGVSVSVVEEQAAATISNLSGEEVDPSAIQEYFNALPEKAVGWLINAAIAIVFILVFWKVINFITKGVRKSMEKARVDESMIHFLCLLLSAGLKILLIFIVAAQLGFNTASIIALLGSAGVAIGLAVQGTLSNLAGGIMILLTKPFRLGDYIIEDTKGHEGTVKEISLFTTRLVTPDNRVIILPNGDLANMSLTNATGNKERLLEIKIGVSYQADLAKTKTVLKDAMLKNGYILRDYEMQVVVSDLKDSSIEMALRCWVKSYDFMSAKWKLNEDAKMALDQAQIEIPYPQLDVHMK